jgi:FkbM family methyltransferase
VDSPAAAARRAVRRFLRRRGLDVVRYEGHRRQDLIRRHAIEVVLDVGANDGPFASSLRDGGYRGRIVSLEPQSAAFERLAARAQGDAAWEVRRVAAGAEDGEATLNLAGNSSSSSLLEMAEQHVRSAPESAYVGTEVVPVVRLDAIRDDLVVPEDRVYLKVDVQGLELDVLRGAEGLLAQCAVVDVELSLARVYEGGTLFPELLEWLAARGFAPAWLEPVFIDPASGRLLQVDGLFVRV